MLKYIYFSFLILVLSCCVESENQTSRHHAPHRLVKKHRELLRSNLNKIIDKCFDENEKVHKAVDSFEKCVGYIDDSLTMCEMFETFLMNCTIHLTDVSDQCLPKEAKGLPSLGVKMVFSKINYLCTQQGEEIFELFNPCIWNDLEPKHRTPAIIKCEKQIAEVSKNYNKDTVPPVKQVCKDLTSFRICLETRITTTCKNPKTAVAFMGLYDAAVAPCSSVYHV